MTEITEITEISESHGSFSGQSPGQAPGSPGSSGWPDRWRAGAREEVGSEVAEQVVGGVGVGAKRDAPVFLTAREVASLLRVTPGQVRRLAAQGLLPAVRHGRRWRFSAPALEQLHARLAHQVIERSASGALDPGEAAYALPLSGW